MDLRDMKKLLWLAVVGAFITNCKPLNESNESDTSLNSVKKQQVMCTLTIYDQQYKEATDRKMTSSITKCRNLAIDTIHDYKGGSLSFECPSCKYQSKVCWEFNDGYIDDSDGCITGASEKVSEVIEPSTNESKSPESKYRKTTSNSQEIVKNKGRLCTLNAYVNIDSYADTLKESVRYQKDTLESCYAAALDRVKTKHTYVCWEYNDGYVDDSDGCVDDGSSSNVNLSKRYGEAKSILSDIDNISSGMKFIAPKK